MRVDETVRHELQARLHAGHSTGLRCFLGGAHLDSGLDGDGGDLLHHIRGGVQVNEALVDPAGVGVWRVGAGVRGRSLCVHCCSLPPCVPPPAVLPLPLSPATRVSGRRQLATLPCTARPLLAHAPTQCTSHLLAVLVP